MPRVLNILAVLRQLGECAANNTESSLGPDNAVSADYVNGTDSQWADLHVNGH